MSRVPASSAPGSLLTSAGCRLASAGSCVLVLCLAGAAVAPAAQEQTLFTFRAGFWLHLHHFLYVLGRAESKQRDSQRVAVAGAKGDEAQGLTGAPPGEVASWRAAVAAYAAGPSRLDAVADEALWQVTSALGPLDEEQSLSEVTLPADTKRALEQAAPIYRRIWWPTHGRRSRSFIDDLQTWLRLEGAVISAFVSWAYDEAWPADGFPVEVSSYANWAGAYSTGNRLLVLSSLDPALAGSQGLETLFHEAMHQWDQPMLERLAAAAKRRGRDKVPNGLSHALLFYTAGEAVRRTVPPHVPYAQGNGIWAGGPLAAYKAPLDTAWRPRLRGDSTLPEALDRLIDAVK